MEVLDTRSTTSIVVMAREREIERVGGGELEVLKEKTVQEDERQSQEMSPDEKNEVG